MVDKIKQYQQSVFDNMPADQGPTDKKFVTTSKTGIPITEAQDIIAKNQKYATDLPIAPFQWLGNKLLPFGDPFGKKNPWLMNEEQKKIQEARQINSAAYIKRKENVQDQLATIFDKAQKKYEETGDEKYQQMALQAKTEILSASGLTDADFLPVNSDTYKLYDEFGLFTNTPNPYPMVEAGMYFAGGVKGFNYGWNGGLIKKFLKGAGKGAVKGKGGWIGRGLNAVVHGALAVGAADMGYEVVLDAMNRAGKAKAFMSMPRAQRDQVVDDSISPWLDKALQTTVDPILEKLPTRLTFGSEGINRPELGSVEDLVPYRFNPFKAKPEGPQSRIASAVDAAVFDAAISTAFFGIRPSYMLFKKFGGWAGGLKTAPPGAGSKIFKGQDETTKELYEDFGVLTGPELIAAEKALQKFDPSTSMYIGTKGRAIAPWGGQTFLPIREPVQMNIPFIGKALTRLMNSKAFNWLGPAEHRTKELFPELETVAGTTIPRFALSGRPYLDAYINAFQRVPAIGRPIQATLQVAGEAQKVRMMEMIGRFAPYVTTAEMGVDYIKMAGKTAEGFRKVAKDYDNQILNAAKSAGAIVDDKTMVQTAKDIIFNRSKMGALSTDFSNFLEKYILKPPEGWTPGTTLLTPGKRTIGDMYKIKRLLDSNYTKWSKSPEIGTISDDINQLYRSFETDIGSLNNTPFANVSKLWTEYENFLSNGMLLWGTDAGKALGNVKRYGWNIALDTPQSATNLSKNLWNTLAKSTDTGAFVGDNILALKNIVGDKAYHRGLGHYLANAFKNSMKNVEGIEYFDSKIISDALGIGKAGSPLQELFKKALPGPKVTDFKIFNPQTRNWDHWYDDLWGKINPSTPKDQIKLVQNTMPTYKDFDNLVKVLDRVFKHGMPSPSTFLARSAVLQGPGGALKQSSPMGTITAAGAAAGAAHVSAMLALVPFFGMRWAGRVFASPTIMRNWTSAMDDTLPTVIRVRAMERLFQEMPDEYQEWTATLQDMEEANRDRNIQNQQQNSLSNIGNAIMDAAPGVLNTADQITPDWVKQPVGETIGYQNQDQPQANIQYDNTYSSGDTTGSSITNSSVMNSQAAANLYTGNTDAALASQYGGMNQGGVVNNLNPVMGNDGKFTDPQKGIKDNPFLKQAQDKGVI
jgi:hypothetical protein